MGLFCLVIPLTESNEQNKLINKTGPEKWKQETKQFKKNLTKHLSEPMNVIAKRKGQGMSGKRLTTTTKKYMHIYITHGPRTQKMVW